MISVQLVPVHSQGGQVPSPGGGAGGAGGGGVDGLVPWQKEPHAGWQSSAPRATQDPSESEAPAHAKVSQSGQQTWPVVSRTRQQREPSGHSALEPEDEQAPSARVMQMP